MRISDWSSDVCSSDLSVVVAQGIRGPCRDRAGNRSGWSDQSVAAVAGTASAGGLSRQRRLGLASDPVAAGLCGDGGGVAVVGSRRGGRSEERLVGEGCVITGRFRWSAYP